MTAECRQEVEQGIAILRARGVVWTHWAVENGLSRQAVSAVVNGRSDAHRGLRFRACEALRAIGRGEDIRATLNAPSTGIGGFDFDKEGYESRDSLMKEDRLREALSLCVSVLSSCLESEPEDIYDLGASKSAADSRDWDLAEAPGRARRTNEALCKAREKLGQIEREEASR